MAQNRSLRVVTGAYKATPVRVLETPLDPYLNKRLLDFEERVNQPSLQGNRKPVEVIKSACKQINNKFQGLTKQSHQKPPQFEAHAQEVARWAGRKQGNEALQDEWKERWRKQIQEGSQRTERLADWDPPELLFTNKALSRHQGLTKAQSSLLPKCGQGLLVFEAFSSELK
ncbi:hypothetical protein VTH82DRAFT_7919 [Thermothelomyces myriococcoides]